jgi:hypothetical protein
MVLFSLVDFLGMVLSLTAAIRNLTGVRLGIVIGLSILVGIVHLLEMVVSMPFS